MSIVVKWQVNIWGDTAERIEFEAHSRFKGPFDLWFDSEAEALEFIAQRKVREDEARKLNQIKECGPELLEALEAMTAAAEYGEFMLESERGRGREIAQLYEAGEMPEDIVKARALITRLEAL